MLINREKGRDREQKNKAKSSIKFLVFFFPMGKVELKAIYLCGKFGTLLNMRSLIEIKEIICNDSSM